MRRSRLDGTRNLEIKRRRKTIDLTSNKTRRDSGSVLIAKAGEKGREGEEWMEEEEKKW
jgi:hypothetical protein